jgi:signal peptidase I
VSQSDSAALDHFQLELAAAMLRSGNTIRLCALGASMLPALWPGDLVTIVPVPCSAVRLGEIVLCVRNQRFCIHRLMQAGTTSGTADWITRGDAMPVPDPAVPAEAILGRVCTITRGGRTMAPHQSASFDRVFGWIVCRSDLLCKLALRVHSLRQRFWTGHGMPMGRRRFFGSQTAP